MDRPEPTCSIDDSAEGVDVDLLDQSPCRVQRVVPDVRDLDVVAGFYRHAIGLAIVGHDAGGMHLGAGGRAFLTLWHKPAAVPAPPGSYGLYHTAFLLPERGDLGTWLSHARESAVVISGAADHFVSEAVYLSDPEGNGVEIYVDRPSSAWYDPGRFPEMTTAPLDAAGLLRAAARRRWSGMPDAGCIGHVHLQVGDVAATDAFYAKLLGFDCNPLAQTAHFYSTGGYHHQIGANCWQSRGAPPRSEGATGLVEMQIVYRDMLLFEAAYPRFVAAGSRVRREDRDLIVSDAGGVTVRLTPPHNYHCGGGRPAD